MQYWEDLHTELIKKQLHTLQYNKRTLAMPTDYSRKNFSHYKNCQVRLQLRIAISQLEQQLLQQCPEIDQLLN